MSCHGLIQGRPDPDGNTYVLDGDVLTNHVFDEVKFLSSSKLSLLMRYPEAHTSSWSEHKAAGHKVFRTVYWKDKAGKTTRTLHEVYDFDAQTVRDDLKGRQDACHHDGR